ncbi:hypothetical protein P691DRAFT_771245 [Macrolepiota fuliginosa MF-IS2]|uniref:Fungal-type protein kinase domain-containing protein n=1 Tax=Macrolepiota fuliginosa MF-IS2 TaxID=1400762 RepID=A0A9P5XMQ9_9AGAR|nr:hypothetical protein P691DRAFT_771245 [Macrolepiota fuliginosa MF-IS2]
MSVPLLGTPTRQPIDPREASAVQGALKEQLSTVSVEVEATTLLDQYFPILSGGTNGFLDTILKGLVEDGLYNGIQERWNDLPVTPSKCLPVTPLKEEDICAPFTRVVNGICNRAKASISKDDQQWYLPGKWIHTNRRALQSDNPSAGTLFPDISFASTDLSIPGEGDSGIWWMHIFTVVEVKITQATPTSQLSSYVRHIFMEQLDRRFVLALTLNTDLLNVYLFDRSGVVCMAKKINIHTEATTFIRVIAGFSCLPPEQLGWDPTCHVWVGQATIPSYAAPTRFTEGRSSAYDLPWVFKCVKGNANSNANYTPSANDVQEFSQYVALRTLSLQDADVIWGRVTLVFEVVTLDDWKWRNPEAKVFVLKQSWQRLPGLEGDTEMVLHNNSNRESQPRSPQGLHPDVVALHEHLRFEPYEAYVIKRAGLGSRLEAAGFVSWKGERVQTMSVDLIKGSSASASGRKDSRVNANSGSGHSVASGRTSKSKSRVSAISETDYQDRTWERQSGSSEDSLATSSGTTRGPLEFVRRSLVRLVFDLQGWPIKNFLDKKELVESFLHMNDELEAMYKNGIIHRDVSLHNGIITKTGGHIIDFDHSKITTQFAPLPRDGAALDLSQCALLSRAYGDEVIQLAERIYGELAGTYLLNASIAHRPSPHSNAYTAHDLGWCAEDGPLYDRPLFTNGQPGKGYITGTPPFTSPQLAAGVVHNGVHDSDSHWWLLFFILVRYTGPATLRSRKTSSDPQDTSSTTGSPEDIEDTEDTEDTILRKYFFLEDEASLRINKINLFKDKKLLLQILEGVSDYFIDLKPLVVSWYDLLTCAWTWPRSYEYHYPHPSVRKVLQRTLSVIEAGGADERIRYSAMIQTEATRRENWYQDNRKAIFNQVTFHALAQSRDELDDPPPPIYSHGPRNTATRLIMPPPVPITHDYPTTPPAQAQNKSVHYLSPSNSSPSSARPEKKRK